MSKHGSSLSLSLLLSTLIVLGACAPGGTQPSATTAAAVAGSGGTLTVRISGQPSFDPTPVGIGALTQIILMYDRLVSWGPDGKLTGNLATSWTATPESVTFKIRDDATCSDGTKMTPTVVANSVKRLMANARGVGIFGKGDYKAIADDVAGTFIFVPPVKNAYTVNLFAGTNIGGLTSIVCPAGLQNGFDYTKNAAGSGPYVLESMTADTLSLKLRPEYKWGPSNMTATTPGVPAKIVLRLVESDTTAANLLLSGELDVATVQGPDARRLESDPRVTGFAANAYGAAVLGFNQSPGRPGADLQVRRAVATAVDRQAALNAAYDGKGAVASSIFGDTAQCFEPATKTLIPQPSTDEAKAILLKAGYTAGPDGKLLKNGEPLKLTVAGSPQIHGSGPEYVAAQLTKVGITVNLRSTDVLTYANNALTNGDFDVLFFSVADYSPLPLAVVQQTVGPWRGSEGGSNAVRSRSATADRAYESALSTTGEVSCNHLKTMQREQVGTFQYFPLLVRTTTNFARKGVLVGPQLNGGHQFQYTRDMNAK